MDLADPNPQPAVASERWFRSLLTNISDTVTLTDAMGQVLFTTGTAGTTLGYPSTFWDGLYPISLVHPDDQPRALDGWRRALLHPRVEVADEVRMVAADGTWHDIAVTGVNLLDDPDVGGIVITTRNITALRSAERLASHQAEVLELIARGEPLPAIADACVRLLADNGFSGSPSIYLLESDRLVMQSGSAARSVQAWMLEPIRDPTRSLCDAAMAAREPVVMRDIAEAGPELLDGLRAISEAEGIEAAWSQPIISITSGEAVGSLSTLYAAPHDPTSQERRVADLTCSLMAIALEREEHQSRLAHQARHDGLTGLPNRTLLLDRLEQALARRARDGRQVALLFCDIDRFKVINDGLGHNVGDQLLVAFAERFASVLDPADTVARFGGDEFVVLLEDLPTDEHPIRIAEQLAEVLSRPFLLPSGNEVFLTVSIGLAMATDHSSGDAWLRDADAAMYRAKDEGRNRLALFDTQMRDAAVVRLQVEHDLRRALERGELTVHYQPFIDLRTGRIVGAEGLVRWQHPERGLLTPADFIEVAEDTGAINELGRHVLDVAVGALRDLLGPEAAATFQLSINISGRQLNAGGLDEVVGTVLAGHGWPAGSLLLEITETAIMHEVEATVDSLDRLRALGVALAIDDFGTGYSSLARLGHLPVDQVKIDRSFVSAIDGGEQRLVRIVDAVVAIAGALDLQTTAEGVETQAQLDYLRRLRCTYAQGYLFSKPLPLDELASLLEQDPRW